MLEQQRREVLTPNDSERAITLTGNGGFHVRITFVCGFVLMAAAFQSNLNAFVLPAAKCTLHLNSEQIGMLNAVFMAGSIVSGYLWGLLADTWGRKKILVISLIIDAALTIVSSISQSYGVFLMFRFLNGFVIGAPCSLVFAYLGEFYPMAHGARVGCYTGFFWNIAGVILPGLAWIIIPLELELDYFNSWRLLVLVLGIPSAVAAIALFYQPESPRYLISKGQLDEAFNVLSNMYALNTLRPKEEYPVLLKPLPLSGANSMAIERSNHSLSMSSTIVKASCQILNVLWMQTRELFTMPVLKYTVLSTTLLFTNMFGYFGLGMWLPELFNRFESFYEIYPNEVITVCDLKEFVEKINQENNITNLTTTASCSDDKINSHVFINSILVGVACVTANIVCGILASRFRPCTIPAFTMFVAGFMAFLIYYIDSTTSLLIVSCLFQASISAGNFIATGCVVQLFPTHIRAMAICTAVVAGRMGAVASNLLFGLLLDINCGVPILLVGCVVLVGGLLALLIPSKEQTCDGVAV